MGKRPDDLAIIDWQNFQGNKAVFPVCMRSPSVNGRSLKAQLLAASKGVDNLVIIICDSLHRFNTNNVVNALDQSVEFGALWLNTNLDTIQEIFPDVEVLRWEKDIRTHPSFTRNLKIVKDLYNTSPAIKRLRDSMSAFYLESKYKRFQADVDRGLSPYFDLDEAIKSSADYLDEEFAGDMTYYEITGGIPHIYHGLYVDDHNIFSQASSLDLPFPKTLAVTSKRHGPSLAASAISHITIESAVQKIGLQNTKTA